MVPAYYRSSTLLFYFPSRMRGVKRMMEGIGNARSERNDDRIFDLWKSTEGDG